MSTPSSEEHRESIRRWVETWRSASAELEAARRRDAESVTLVEAIRQLFDGMESVLAAPAPATSGLVEQQMWFSKIRNAAKE